MKRLSYVLMCLIFNVSGMLHVASSVQKSILKNRQLCFNDTPRNFGTTHFIIGYNGNNNSKKRAQKKHSVFQKKQGVLLDSVSLIDKNRISQSFFTTVHDLSPLLLEIMSEAKKCLYIAAFTLTDFRIVNHVLNAHKNGVDVCVITDASSMKNMHSKIHMLVDGNVEVWCYKPSLNPTYKRNGLSEPFMHHKIIIGDDFVLTGSANFTKAGQKTNIENVNILRDKQTVGEHHAEFERLKKFCVKCTSQAAA